VLLALAGYEPPVPMVAVVFRVLAAMIFMAILWFEVVFMMLFLTFLGY